MGDTPKLSRRSFARFLGLGAGAALASPILARGWEERLAEAAGAPIAPLKRLPNDPANLILLNSNENPYGPPPAAREAMSEAFEVAGRYPDFYADQLQEKVAEVQRVESGSLVLTCGSTELLRMCAAAFLGPGKRLVQAWPTFEALAAYARPTGAEVVNVPLDAYYRHDLDAMAEAAAEKPGLVYICNPNNPTGTVVPRAAIEGFLKKVPAETVVLVDEAYFEFADEPGYGTLLGAVKEGQNVVVARTFSKIYGMAGLRLGYGVAKPELIARLRPHRVFSSGNVMACGAAYAVLAEPREHRRFLFGAVQQSVESRTGLTDALRSRGFEVVPSNTNFVCVDIGRPVEPVIEAFLEQGIRVGRRFDRLPTHLRISLGLPEEMERFYQAWDQVLGEARPS